VSELFDIPLTLTHAEQYQSIIDRLNSKKSFIRTVVGVESPGEAEEVSAERPIAAVLWIDEKNENPTRPLSMSQACQQPEYRDWIIVLVVEQVGDPVKDGINAKCEVVSILQGWTPCRTMSRYVKIRAFYSHAKDTLSVYGVRLRSWGAGSNGVT